MLRFGILGLTLSFIAIFAVLIVVLGTDMAVDTLQPFFCDEGEMLHRQSYPDGEVTYLCSNDDRTVTRDVTEKTLFILIAPFVLMTLFILITVKGSKRSAPTLMLRSGISIAISMDKQKRTSGIVSSGQSAGLSETMEDLQSLYYGGHLSQDEYDRIRKRQIDEL